MTFNECICIPPNVLNLGCPIHGPDYQRFRERMMQPSLTDELQQSDWFKDKGKDKEKIIRVYNRRMKRQAAKAKGKKNA